MTPALQADLQTFFARMKEDGILFGWHRDWCNRLSDEVDECRTDNEIIAAARAVVEGRAGQFVAHIQGQPYYEVDAEAPAVLRAAVEGAEEKQ